MDNNLHHNAATQLRKLNLCYEFGTDSRYFNVPSEFTKEDREAHAKVSAWPDRYMIHVELRLNSSMFFHESRAMRTVSFGRCEPDFGLVARSGRTADQIQHLGPRECDLLETRSCHRHSISQPTVPVSFGPQLQSLAFQSLALPRVR